MSYFPELVLKKFVSIVVPEPHLFPLVSPVSMVTVLTKDVAIMEDSSQ